MAVIAPQRKRDYTLQQNEVLGHFSGEQPEMLISQSVASSVSGGKTVSSFHVTA